MGLNYLIFSVLCIFFLGNRKKKFEYKIEKKIIEEELRKERRIVFMGSLNNSEAFWQLGVIYELNCAKLLYGVVGGSFCFL